MAANNNPNTSLATSASLHPNQSSLATALGLDMAKLSSVAAVVDAIESTLGKVAEEESARWFAVSVLRHLRKAKWSTPRDSDLDDAGQKDLAKGCLAVDGFSASLRTVIKDSRSKFRIVGFASSKKIERGVLATGTKAYKIAVNTIVAAGLAARKTKPASYKTTTKKKVDPQPQSKSESKPELKDKLKEVEKTVVGRRAKRRGYSIGESMPVGDTLKVTSEENQTVSMSKEEFAGLDAALSKNDAEIIQQNWDYQQNEDRWSRLLGLLAGVGFFVFVALLLL
jgi:hypothetical protein|tara:strand:- start:736 stop:1581 length:846 start_codon:yes stop_codon:yes gene_type:complete